MNKQQCAMTAQAKGDTTKTIHVVGIDVETYFARRFVHALRRLKGTMDVALLGEYLECREDSQVMYTGVMTEQQVDEWACRVKAGMGYVGTWEVL